MKVVLRDDVESLGRKGDLVDVADGYARNYLVPRGLAMKATRGGVAQAVQLGRGQAGTYFQGFRYRNGQLALGWQRAEQYLRHH